MESNAHYKTVGLIVILLLAGTILAGIWLSVGFTRAQYTYYTIYMKEPVSGLTKDSLVKYNGVRVGSIIQIELNKNQPEVVRLVISVRNDTPLSEYTYASLISQGITGATYLGLLTSDQNMGSLKKIPGEPYLVITTKPSFYHDLETTLRELSQVFKKIFDTENIQNLSQSITNLTKISETIANNNQNINKALKELPEAINKFAQMTQEISVASKQVEQTMKSGKEGFDKIKRQAIPPTVLFLQRLNAIGSNLEQISEQLKMNPSVIIRGTTPPPPGPGE